MVSRGILKARAKQVIDGRIFKLFLAFFIIGILMSIVNRITMGNEFTKGLLEAEDKIRYIQNSEDFKNYQTINTFLNIFYALFDIGLAKIFLDALKANKVNYSGLVFSFSKISYLGKHLLMIILRYIIIILYFLLLIIPGIIKAFSYVLTNFLMADKPELSAKQCLKLSSEMMKGYKLDYFFLVLSFIGWFFFIVITLGFGLIYVAPYYMATMTQFYIEVKKEYAKSHPDIFPDMIKKEETNNTNNQNIPPVFEEFKQN